MTNETISEIENDLCAKVARLLEIEFNEVQPELSLGELGMDSVAFVELSRYIQSRFARTIPPDALYEHSSIAFTAKCIASSESRPKQESAVDTSRFEHERIAVIGASFRLPGASNWDELDQVLNAKPRFHPVPQHRWPTGAGGGCANTLRAAVLDDIARFDAAFFGISPREALAMDPQQRLLMECAWHAMESAGLEQAQWQGSRTSVFVGASGFDYSELLQRTGAGRANHVGTGLSHAILANRLSQYFNLRGSSEAIDTACSSSLVALWRAVGELRAGVADMALVAGVNVFASATPFQAFAEAGMLSQEGACLPFDQRASGYVRGEGVIVVLLKPLSMALEDSDRILGVIRGGAVRHSGRTQSLTAPNPESQAEVIQAALDDAGVGASDISYIEAHGTGTSLGDPIEIRGLKKILDRQGESALAPSFPCRVSSIKAQIGHLEAAAGLAGVIKVLHCFRHNRLPANPHLKTINELIDLSNSRLSLETDATAWTLPTGEEGRTPRRLAGVSSFGFGGTNAHLIIEQADGDLAKWDMERQHYVFQGQRYWPAFESHAPSIATVDGLECLQTRWQLQELPRTSGSSTLAGMAWVILAGSQGSALADVLAFQLPAVEWVKYNWSQLERQLQQGASSPDYWIDLSALDDDPGWSSETTLYRLDLMSRLLGSKLKSGATIRVLQATVNLQDLTRWGHPCRSLAGAGMNAIYHSLGAEYTHCQSKTIDFASQVLATDHMARILIEEMRQMEAGNSIAYVDWERMVPCLEQLPLSPGEHNPMRDAVVVITGGLGDIGRQLSADLVKRGIKALLITARRSLSAKQNGFLEQLRRSGVKIDYYQGALLDEAALRSALDSFGQSCGRITHLFHCAGFVDEQNLAFYKKTKMSMKAVFEPKMDSLDILHRYFAERPLKACVLFSSISAIEPKSAVGLLDYAAANRYMDLYAAYRNADSPAVYRTIQWDAWQSTAMGNKAQQSARKRKGLDTDSALQALYATLTMNPENTTLGIRSLETHADDSRKPSSTVHGIAPAERPPGRAVSIERLLPELRILMARELEIDEAKIDDNASFNDLGVDSIILMDLIGAIEQWLGLTVEPDSLIQCDSIARTARYLADRIASISPPVGADSDGPGVNESGPRARNNSGRDSFKVAVIGMACRVPGAADLAEFWRNLEEGIDSVVAIPPDHRWGQVQAPDGSLRWAGLIDNHDSLYPKLFDMSAQEAVDVDPSVRLFTECGLQAIHDSPVGLDGVRGRRVGVFVGARAGRYGERIKVPGKRSITGVGQNFISSYLSHVLDLRGPNLVLDSACSSSLAAVHVACQSLEGGDCELAVAGGVDVLLDQKTHEFLSAAKALSADGRCRPFSRDANGFVPGEGVGAVVLKPLEKALADGDPVYAVIDGSAINNDGNTLGITTPSVDGQVDVIRRALERSGVSPKDISYVEAHGTGTMIGDPIELQSLARAYREDPPERCGVGSVKSNVGHLLSAAGIVSFVKVALSLHQRTIPPTLHCEEINPRIGFDRLPFYPVVAPTHWPEGRAGRKAGVSAFGFGKTNVHLILSERPKEAAMPTIQSRALPTELCGEQVRAWRDISAEDKSVQDLRPALMALQDVIVEEIA